MNQEYYDALTNRFYDFADGVIRSVCLTYLNDGSKDAEIVVACRDSEGTSDEGWVVVTLHVRGLMEFKAMEGPRTTLQVLSDGLHVCVYDELVGIEFGGTFEPSPSIAELRKSDGFAIGKEVKIEVGPY